MSDPATAPDDMFTREHFERYMRAQWAGKGEALAPDARLGIAIGELVASSIERNAKLDAPYLDLWIAILDEMNSWLVSLLSAVYSPAKTRDTPMNGFERSVVVFLGKLIAETTALRHLITLGFDGSAWTLLRSITEYVHVVVALIDDPALASEFVAAETRQTANAFYFRQLARGRLHKRLEAAWASFLKSGGTRPSGSPISSGVKSLSYREPRIQALDLPRLSGEAFAQRDAVRSNCAGLM